MNGPTDVTPRTVLERAAILEERAKRLKIRKGAAADAYALSEARKEFTEALADLREVLALVKVLRAAGDSIRLPNPERIAKAINELADQIDADPVNVRERRRQTDMLTTYVETVQREIDERVESRVTKARGGAEGGLIAALRQLGLNDAAARLETALETLDRFKNRLPRTAEDIAAIDAAAASIAATLEEIEEPRHARLLEFFRRAVIRPRPTLSDIDAALLQELQASGAAANFSISPRER